MIWFTADTHFGHTNIIRHCGRPFTSVKEMDQTLLRNINDRVKPSDTLYHLGDFAFGAGGPAIYRRYIKCRRLILIIGNHDPHTAGGYPKADVAALFSEVHLLLRIKVPIAGKPQLIVLCHYAMRVWDRLHHGAWHLFGHSHGTLPDDPNARSWDVGVDTNGLRPVSLDEVAAIMEQKRFKPMDQHRTRLDLDL
jgi:calcineurin-like phosphoesterase family protein